MRQLPKPIVFVAGAGFALTFVVTCASPLPGELLADAGEFFGIDAGVASSRDGGAQPGSDGGISIGFPNAMALYKGGSRIKARVWRTADGAQQFAGWYDAQLAMNCGPLPDSVGQLRCLPATYMSLNLFGDESCSTLIGTIPFGGSCTVGRIASVGDSTRPLTEFGAYPTKVFALTGDHVGDVFYKSSTTCGRTPRAANYSYCLVGTERALSEFVAFTETIE